MMNAYFYLEHHFVGKGDVYILIPLCIIVAWASPVNIAYFSLVLEDL